MMQLLRNTSYLLLSLFTLIICIGCCNDDEPIIKPRPTLSATSLNLEVGEEAILHIENTDSAISATTNAPNVISLQIDGTNIIVQALAQGEATIAINAHGARLRCDVVVTESQAPQHDFDKELHDQRCRFVSPSLSLYYDIPGTIFSISNGRIIEVRNLSTGDYATFDMGTNSPSQGQLENTSLTINGTAIALKSATLEQLAPDGSMWLNLLDENNNRIIIVVTDL